MTKCGSTSKYQLYQHKRKTDQNRASERFLRLTKHGPCQSRAQSGEWLCLLSIILQFSPRDCLGPRLAGIESLTLTV